jgi:hypothetical protein
MAYDPTVPPALIGQDVGGTTALRFWAFYWVDPIADVLADGYFTNAADLGMRAGDSVYYKDTNRGEWCEYHLIVESVDATTGAGTVAFPEVPEEALEYDATFDPEEVDAYFVAFRNGRMIRVPANTGALVKATQAEAEAGVNNDTYMTPLRTDQHFDAVFAAAFAAALAASDALINSNNLSDVGSAATAFANIKQAATTSATGVVELATEAEVEARTDANRAVTPAGLAAFGVERLQPAAMSTQQNNYASGMSTSAMCLTVLELTPTNSFVLTGLDSTGVEFYKRVRLYNAGGASAGAIVLAFGNASSSAANRFHTPQDVFSTHFPLIILPGRHVDLYFDGVDWAVELVRNGFGIHRNYDYEQPRITIAPKNSATTTGGGSIELGYDDGTYKLPMSRLDTGTAVPGRVYLNWGGLSSADDDERYGVFGEMAMCFISLVSLVDLSDATDTFVVQVGMFSHANTVFDDVPCAWYYTHGGNWKMVTRDDTAGTETFTDSGIVPATGDLLVLGGVINGEGSRADFIYSTDHGDSFTIVTQSTNLPDVGDYFNVHATIAKGTGTNNRSVMFSGPHVSYTT